VGTFRLILALCVVVAHASPLPGLATLDAGLAVKTFFMISGFYMALILAEKYPATPAGRSLFYTNRFLRIYPLYLVTLAGALLFYAAASIKLGHPADRLQLWSAAWGRGERGSLILVGLSQLSVFGLDLTPLFTVSPSQGFHLLTSSLPADATLAWRLNFLPHCWSIGAELLFYALSPFLMRLRPGLQAVLCAVGLAGALGIQSVDHPLANSAAYHVGLLQLPYFLLGIVAYTVLGKVAAFRPTAGAAAVPVGIGLLDSRALPPHETVFVGPMAGGVLLSCLPAARAGEVGPVGRPRGADQGRGRGARMGADPGDAGGGGGSGRADRPAPRAIPPEPLRAPGGNEH
jgi:peptidoglycan/LPS O-acetylase OafA/YrhL